eukprot:3977318-Pyramimonas_sp.AAC.1
MAPPAQLEHIPGPPSCTEEASIAIYLPQRRCRRSMVWSGLQRRAYPRHASSRCWTTSRVSPGGRRGR